jgi:hypothetical protein
LAVAIIDFREFPKDMDSSTTVLNHYSIEEACFRRYLVEGDTSTSFD